MPSTVFHYMSLTVHLLIHSEHFVMKLHSDVIKQEGLGYGVGRYVPLS